MGRVRLQVQVRVRVVHRIVVGAEPAVQGTVRNCSTWSEEKTVTGRVELTAQ